MGILSKTKVLKFCRVIFYVKLASNSNVGKYKATSIKARVLKYYRQQA